MMEENENNNQMIQRKKRETKAFCMNMNVNTYQRLGEYCKKEKKTKTSVIETAINYYLDVCYKEELQKNIKQ